MKQQIIYFITDPFFILFMIGQTLMAFSFLNGMYKMGDLED